MELLQEVWKTKVLAPALRRWAREMRSAIERPSGWADQRAFFATEELAPVLAASGPGERHRVDGLVVWIEGEKVRFEADQVISPC